MQFFIYIAKIFFFILKNCFNFLYLSISIYLITNENISSKAFLLSIIVDSFVLNNFLGGNGGNSKLSCNFFKYS